MDLGTNCLSNIYSYIDGQKTGPKLPYAASILDTSPWIEPASHYTVCSQAEETNEIVISNNLLGSQAQDCMAVRFKLCEPCREVSKNITA